MRIRLTVVIGLLTLIFPLVIASAARAQTPDQPDTVQADATQVAQQTDSDQTDAQDNQPSARVIRIFSIQGSVSFQRAGDNDWYDAAVNLPLFAGDQVYAGPGSRAILQLDRSIFIALGESTDLSISQLDDSTGQFELPGGAAVIEATGLKSAFDLLEIDTPVSSMVVNQDGLYRLDVGDDGGTVATVQTGSADVASADGGVTLATGHMAQVGPAGSGLLQSSNLVAFDDLGLGESETSAAALAQAGPPGDRPDQLGGGYPPAPDYVSTYENTYDGLYGADELSGYGTWTYYATYGNIWLPRVGTGWTPFRFGHWIFVKRIGWTWVPSETWGWATSHYGRWAFIPNFGWAWVPGFGPGRPGFVTGPAYYAWRPALVTFFKAQAPSGILVAWVPLSPLEKWHRPASTAPSRPAALPHSTVLAKGLSVMPVSAFEGGVKGSPAAPGPELTPIFSKQPVARTRRYQRKAPESTGLNAGLLAAGLIDVHPTRAATSPVGAGTGQTAAAAQPPVFILRPVVTRHMPSTPLLAKGTAGSTRQRTLLRPAPAPLLSNSRADSAATVGKIAPKRVFVKNAKQARTGPVYTGVGHPVAAPAESSANASEGGNGRNEAESGTVARGQGSKTGASSGRSEGGSEARHNAGQPARESERPDRETERPARSTGSAAAPRSQQPARAPAPAPAHFSPPAASGGGKH